MLHTTCGTPNYVAPEVLGKDGYDGKKADVWSVGVILYVLLAGYLPFDENTMAALFQKIKNAEFDFPDWFTPEAKDLISKILVPDPQKRPKLSDIKNHPWMLKGDDRRSPSPATASPATTASNAAAVPVAPSTNGHTYHSNNHTVPHHPATAAGQYSPAPQPQAPPVATPSTPVAVTPPPAPTPAPAPVVVKEVESPVVRGNQGYAPVQQNEPKAVEMTPVPAAVPPAPAPAPVASTPAAAPQPTAATAPTTLAGSAKPTTAIEEGQSGGFFCCFGGSKKQDKKEYSRV